MSLRVPLPKWVVEEVGKDQDLAYTDQWGRRNYEYVSLWCDSILVLKGRTPVQCYSDFMRAFRDNFKHLLSDTIVKSRWEWVRQVSSAFLHTRSRMELGNFLESRPSNVTIRVMLWLQFCMDFDGFLLIHKRDHPALSLNS